MRAWRAWDVADGLDLADLISEVPGIGIAIALVVAGLLIGVLAVFFVVPAVALLVEMLIVVLIAAGTLIARVLLRQPWLVIAQRTGTNEAVLRRVVGFKAAGRAVDELAQGIASGQVVSHAVLDES